MESAWACATIWPFYCCSCLAVKASLDRLRQKGITDPDPEALNLTPMRAGVCSLRGNAQGVAHMAKCTVLYYTGTTAVSVCLGIALVSIIYPGRGHPLGGASMRGDCYATTPVVQVIHVLVIVTWFWDGHYTFSRRLRVCLNSEDTQGAMLYYEERWSRSSTLGRGTFWGGGQHARRLLCNYPSGPGALLPIL